MTRYIALLTALIPSLAFATDPKPPEKPPEPPKAEAKAYASSRSYANSEANSASEANNELNASFRDVRQAPAVLAPSIAPSAPCYYSHSGGVSVPGFGASGGKAIKDGGCELRENIRLAYSMGLTREADYLFCSTIGKDIPDCGKPVEPPKTECETKVERVFEKCLAK